MPAWVLNKHCAFQVFKISSNDGKSDKLYIKSKSPLLEPLQELCLPPDSFTITLLLDIFQNLSDSGKLMVLL